LRGEHAYVESRLDRLDAAIREGAAGMTRAMRSAASAALAHYDAETMFLDTLSRRLPGPAAKAAAQHEEAREIAHAFEDALEAGHAADAEALARRFLAIAQHNIIEEERDLFPLAARLPG
jgi:hypothetical protein